MPVIFMMNNINAQAKLLKMQFLKSNLVDMYDNFLKAF